MGNDGITRRQFAIGAVMAASGDGLRRPLNAPPAGQAAYGIPPNSSKLIIAQTVIVSGPAGAPVGVFVYAPGSTPQLGNNPIAWESSSLTDPFGNVLPQHAGATDFYIANSLEMVYGTPGTPPVNGLIAFVNNSDNTLSYKNGQDSGVYRTGYQASFGNSGQLISSVAATAISGMAVAVGAGIRYHVQGWVNFTGTGAVGQAQFGFDGATLSHGDGGAFFLVPGTGAVNPSVFNGALALAGSPVMTGNPERWEFDVWVVISGGASFTVTAQEGNAGDSFTVNSGYIRAETF
jgi:hypothetical protein